MSNEQMRTPVLQMEHIQKHCGDLTILKDVSLTLYAGQTLAIIGPSGAGKSTLLRCAAGLTDISGGSIFMEKQPQEPGKHRKKMPGSGCGMVFQGFQLFPHFTVLKNLTDPQMRVLGRPRKDAEARAMQLLRKVGLADKTGAYPAQLSGGQQQRAAIARALCMEPRLLLFDEPTSALDPELTAEVLKLIRQLAQEGMTMMIVTHQLTFARDVSDRILLLEDGAIVEEGSPEQIFVHPQQPRTRQFLSSMGV